MIKARKKSHGDGQTQQKIKYRIANWSEYNTSLIGRGSITIWIEPQAIANWYYQSPERKELKNTSSSSMQSVHDPKAAYRTIGEGASKQSVNGYHANIVERCDPEDEVNLILDVEVTPANICENKFLTSEIDNSEAILQQAYQTQSSQIEEAITDSGYDSIDNMLKEQRPQWSMAKTKGGKGIYEIEKDDKGNITVEHLPSQQKCNVNYSQRTSKYVLINPDGSKRYYDRRANR